ncbi:MULTISPECIES: ABC transporter permease [unclassified Wenzhouxiangella]|uniref:ABC transporter permease n=1 Tax=unclassified Wenzhouxiangella TaxID=2613841 RepID=UPI000E326B58|nr:MULTISPECIES: ABC transporter permease [unclassified Wenzhouxiangella]RFF26790.1 ABC transporter permease [Wenzhouxiangella sp. 15181]RFP67686.1 ABC transporter permease [Wenzhouxiangella sp. 15190]
MTLLRLAWHSLLNRRTTVMLTIFTIALSIALLVLVEQLRQDVRDGFYRSVSGTDMIVGARTAPVQLLLNTVFGIGTPGNSISHETLEHIRDQRMVEWTIPLLIGDSHRGERVIGTTQDFFEHYRYADRQSLEMAAGEPFADLFDVVIGHQIARRFGYSVGDEIHLAHGGGNVSLHEHEAHPFTVRGALEPTGTPVDRNLYIPVNAYGVIHVGWESGVHRPGSGLDPDEAREQAHEHEPEEISAVLVGLTTPAAVFGLQRDLNEYEAEPLTALMPGITLQQLWRLTGVAELVLRAVAVLVVITGLLGMVTVLLTTLNERRREMAILRANGARAWQIAALLVFEAGLIVAGGLLLGILLAFGAIYALGPWLLEVFGLAVGVTLPEPWQWAVLGGIFVIGLLVALAPAIMAYRRTLADGMQVRL